MVHYSKQFATPFGDMIASVNEANALIRLVLPIERDVRWPAEIASKGYQVVEAGTRCDAAIGQLTEYFSGARRTFDLPLEFHGTDFQKRVWTELLNIPYGVVISYRDLAERLGNLAAIRAVGRANGSNPIPIIVPCHRVIGADGSLTGYGGGLPLKEQLLTLEGIPLNHKGKPSSVQPSLFDL